MATAGWRSGGALLPVVAHLGPKTSISRQGLVGSPSHLTIVFDNCRVVLAPQLLDQKSGDVIGYSDHLGLGGPQVSQGARDSGSTRLRACLSEGSIPLPTHRTNTPDKTFLQKRLSVTKFFYPSGHGVGARRGDGLMPKVSFMTRAGHVHTTACSRKGGLAAPLSVSPS